MQKKRNTHKKSNHTHTLSVEKLTGDEREGFVIAHFGSSAEIEDVNGQVFHCHLRRNAEPCMTGDHILWRLEQDQTGVIVGVLPRRSLLARPLNQHKVKLIAANIDVMVITTAPGLLLSEYLIDCYLVAAEHLNIQPIILLNKMDLLTPDELSEYKTRFAIYEKLGYSVVYSSIYLDNGLQSLIAALQQKTSALVGVSGVGKSSIIAELTGVSKIMIGQVSEAAGLGKHTTTTTRLYHLPQGGNIIDSPGVREFSLWHLPAEDVIKSFVDFHPYLGACKYRNCQHNSEQGCALLEAVEEGKIHPSRWKSYWEILDQTSKR